MPAPPVVLELIERFQRNYQTYRSLQYNEAALRQEFVNPLFKALGWDMDNAAGYAEPYKDVIHEDALKIGGTTKAPDYSFRIGGQRKFFVETKKPAVNIQTDDAAAFQLRRYGWTAKLPLCILTDFEEFAVYDCRVEPDKKDKPSAARLKLIPYTEYATRWEEIVGLFAPLAILRGAFDAYAAEKTRRGTAPVDVAFLREIEGWRESLAKNIALRNGGLAARELNDAVGRIIDRIVFLRICEDRGIERGYPLQALRNGPNTYPRLLDLFRRADQRYNSGLFHFEPEKGRSEAPDELTPSLVIDNKPIKDILARLYYPDSPYAFDFMPADILGQVYEQFLGKVIRLEKGRALIEPKPEVKKAGGVYYTPSYIVHAIVDKTVGVLCAGKTPAEVAKLKILDPACGSGSFLLGAYEYLLDWHLKYYTTHDPDKWSTRRNPPIYRAPVNDPTAVGPTWRLTTGERKRMVLDNLHGVDIDPQAVEVTKLSLLLKVIEGETNETLQSQMRLLHDRGALPDLDSNIKCGNSLIDSASDAKPADRQLTEAEEYRMNAFNWRTEYPAIMQAGGFDVVIGNPPYIRIQAMKEWVPLEVECMSRQYRSATQGNYDIYVVFVERGLRLLNARGRMGYILPHKFFNAQYGGPLRGLLAQGRHVSDVVHFGHQQVFATATTYTCLLFASRAANENVDVTRVDDLLSWRSIGQAATGRVPAGSLSEAEWNFATGESGALFDKLAKMPVKLGHVAERMAQGIRTSANEVYVLDLVEDRGDLIDAHSTQLNETVTLERDTVALFLQGREIKPYRVLPSGKVVILPYRIDSRYAQLIAEGELKQRFPHTHSYFCRNKAYLEDREKGRFRGAEWYVYGRPQNIDLMLLPKILVPDIADRASFALDEVGQYAFTSGYGITLQEGVSESAHYILGLLNSRVLNFYLRSVSTPLRGGFFRYFTQFIEQLPIRTIDFANRKEKARHDRMVELVESMLRLHREHAEARLGNDKARLARRIADTDTQIDRLVYELYGLSDNEIAIVEGTSAAAAIAEADPVS